MLNEQVVAIVIFSSRKIHKLKKVPGECKIYGSKPVLEAYFSTIPGMIKKIGIIVFKGFHEIGFQNNAK